MFTHQILTYVLIFVVHIRHSYPIQADKNKVRTFVIDNFNTKTNMCTF